MEDQKNKTNWQEGFKIFSEVSTWVIIPIVLSLIFGKILDTHFGTKPWIFLGLTAIAFLISIGGIAKILGKYIKDIEKEKKNKNGDNTNS